MPHAFQETEWVVAGSQDAFQQTAFDLPVPTKAFQPNAWQELVSPDAFQNTAYDDEAFQGSTDAFQDTAAQGDAFQRDERPLLVAAPPAPFRSGSQAVRRALLTRRRARHAIVARAPSVPTPTPLTRPGVQVVTDNRHRRPSRLALGRGRRVKPKIVASLVQAPPPKQRIVVEQVTQLRPVRARVRRRKPQLLRAPSVPTQTALVRKRLTLQMVTQQRPLRFRKLRRGPRVGRAPSVPTVTPLVKPTLVSRRQRRPARRQRRTFVQVQRVAPLFTFVRPKVIVQGLRRTRFFTRRHPRLLRAPSVTTPTPLVRKGVQLVRSDATRLAKVARLRRRKPQIIGSSARGVSGILFRSVVLIHERTRNALVARIRHRQATRSRAPSVPTATPLVRRRLVLETTVLARGKLARLRQRKPRISSSRVFSVRPRPPVVEQQTLRARRRRFRKPLILRPRVFWQRPAKPILSRPQRRQQTVRQHRQPRILRSYVVVPVGPGPSTVFGDVLVSDQERFDSRVSDSEQFHALLADGRPFVVQIADGHRFLVLVSDSEQAGVLVADKPGG